MMRIKRWLAALLALTLCLGLISMGAAAEETTQQLYLKSMRYDNGYYLPENGGVSTTWNGAEPGIGRNVVFCTDQAATKLVPVDELVFSSDCMSLNVTEERFLKDKALLGYGCYLIPETFGTCVISYTDGDGVTYSMTINISLPAVSFYSSPVRSEDTYLNSMLPYRGEPTKSYLLLEDGAVVTNIDTDPYEEDQDLSFFQWENEAVDGKQVVAVTISEGFQSDEAYSIRVDYTDAAGVSRWNYSLFSIYESTSGLGYRFLTYGNDGPYVNTSEPLHREINLQMGFLTTAVFYWSDGQEETMLDYSQLSCTGPISLKRSFKLDYATDVNTTNIGEAAVTYTRDGKTYSVPVHVTLPGVGLYSTATASEEYYMNGSLCGTPGETVTGYLLPLSGTITGFTVSLFDRHTFNDVMQETQLDDSAKTILARYGITLTENEEKTWIRIDAVIDRSLQLSFHATHSEESSFCSVYIEDTFSQKESRWRANKSNPTVTFDGVTYTFGMGSDDSNGYSLYTAGVGFGYSTEDDSDVSETVSLLAVSNYAQANEAEAPEWLYKCISDVSFEVVDFINIDDYENQQTSNVTVSEVSKNDKGHYTATFTSLPGAFVTALVRVSFTLTLPDQEPVRYSSENIFNHEMYHELALDLSGTDTASELNELLGSDDAFLSWLTTEKAEQYSQYKSGNSYGRTTDFRLNLPNVSYDGVITLNVNTVQIAGLSGSWGGGKRTTMPGLRVCAAGCSEISEIDFVANPAITQTYDGETFTCGVLSAGSADHNQMGEVNWIRNCTFTGFDYGVRNTSWGYSSPSSGNRFRNCKIGILHDCAEKQWGNMSSFVSRCSFEGCGEAIRLLGFPKGISAASYSPKQCDFISNTIDLNSAVTDAMNLNGNYFGEFAEGITSTDQLTSLSQVRARAARVQGPVTLSTRYANPCTVSLSESNKILPEASFLMTGSLLGQSTMTAEQIAAADRNNDGVITSADLVLLAKELLSNG